jgi:hypothetical protein
MFKLTGVAKVISPTVQVSEKFKKRDLVITDTSSTYPQDILFQLTQDKVDILDAFMEGQTLEVSFNLRGREWTSPQGEVKYFNTLEAWRIELPTGATAAKPAPQAAPQAAPLVAAEGDDDLPF